MGSMNISVPYLPNPLPAGVGLNGTYQRVDTTGNPVVNVNGITGYPADLTPTGVPNGQYNWTLTPTYADGRTCPALTGTTPACPGITGVSAQQVGNNIVVTYTAPASVSQVFLTIIPPNGGTGYTQYFTNGNAIVYPIPAGLYGTYAVYLQSVCDSSTGFLSAQANGGSVTVSAPVVSPSLTGTLAVTCVGDCSAQVNAGLQFNLTQPLSNDLTVQIGYTLTSPSGATEPIQQYGCSIIPSAYLNGTCNAQGYATFVIPGGVLQVNIPAPIQFNNGNTNPSFWPAMICFCGSNPDVSEIYVSQIFIHPVNQPSIAINLTPVDNRITIIQV